MSGIRTWLDRLDLGEYAEAFEAEKIKPADLHYLTETDLKDLGLALGPRRRALAAIATMAANEAGQEPQGATPTVERSRDAGRRQITVMFCDMVGSTALSEELDPEELRSVLRAYRKACSQVVERYDGHVAQYLGDGLMVYFGWPIAHEDDAQRAVRAGLEIVAAVATLEATADLSLRVGIATGLVVVGESGADEGARLAVGETPNIAARIQGLAEGGSVAIAQSTRRLLGGAFVLDDLGSHDAKGVSGGLQIYRVVGAAETESRFDATHGTGSAMLTPLVGRESEISLLVDHWDQAKEGEGQVVLLSGEAGIGKSRITQVLRERLADEPHIRLRYQCSPYYTNSAFYPVIDQLERAAGFTRDDSADQKLDKLEATLALGCGDVARVAPLIASMLSLPTDRYPPLNLSPQRQKDDTIAALAAQVAGLARDHPVLMLFEDAHWCDPTTLDVLTAVISAIATVPVFLVVTFRPEFDPPWTGHGHVVAQSLSRLGRRQGAEMVNRVTGGKSMPDEVLDQIVAKTDGVPLFVEELTKTVLEAGFLKDTGASYALEGPVPPLAIPVTLKDSLTARLDRLSTVKEVAQIAACIGREFSYDLLAAVSRVRENELLDALQQLVNSELVFRVGTGVDGQYIFKHALVQDAAYEGLLKSRRVQVHARIAETLESDYADIVANEPDLLARHLTEAGLPGRAIPAWLDAARKNFERNSLVEAIEHSAAGLALVPKLDEGSARRRLEVDLLSVKANAHMVISGYSSDQFEQALLRSNEVCREADFDSDRVSVLWGLSLNAMNRARFPLARERVTELINVADGLGTRESKVTSRFCAAAVAHWSGDLHEASGRIRETLSSTSPGEHADLTQILGHEPYATTVAFRALLAWQYGFIDKAVTFAETSIREAEKVDHGFNLCFVLMILSPIFVYRGDQAQSEKLIARAEQIAREQSLDFVTFVMAPWKRCLAAAEFGNFREGIEAYQGWVPVYDAIGGKIIRQEAAFSCATCHAGLGQLDEAWSACQAALVHSTEFNDDYMLPEVFRVAGEVSRLRAPNDPGIAGSYFRQAVDAAKSRELKFWELRAATSFARMLHSESKTEDAHTILAPVYEWFTEGLDTHDLQQARALLKDLGWTDS